MRRHQLLARLAAAVSLATLTACAAAPVAPPAAPAAEGPEGRCSRGDPVACRALGRAHLLGEGAALDVRLGAA